MENKCISVIIPAYNEEDLIYETVTSVKTVPRVNQVIVVDDGSKDNTATEVKRADAELVKLNKNMGKGFAMNKGYLLAKEKIIAFLDADLGSSSTNLSTLAYPVMENKFDISIAKLKKANNSQGFGIIRFISGLCIYLLTGKKITAPLSGQRVMTREVAEKIFPLVGDFGVELDGTIKAFENNFRLIEIEVEMEHRKTDLNFMGIKHRMFQGYQIFKTILLRGLKVKKI